MPQRGISVALIALILILVIFAANLSGRNLDPKDPMESAGEEPVVNQPVKPYSVDEVKTKTQAAIKQENVAKPEPGHEGHNHGPGEHPHGEKNPEAKSTTGLPEPDPKKTQLGSGSKQVEIEADPKKEVIDRWWEKVPVKTEKGK